MKKVLVLLLIALPMLLMQSKAQNLKFGHINSQELLQKMPEMDAALGSLEDMQASNNEKLKLMQDELKRLNELYVSQAKGMDAITRQSKETELQQMNQNIQTFYQTAQQEMKQKQGELTQPVIEKARSIVEEVGKENGFLYIFDTSKGEVLFMGSESVDVLPLVLKKLGISENAPAQ